MSRPKKSWPTLSWKAAIYYGEVVGFLAAWIAGVAALTQDWGEGQASVSVDRIAAVDPAETWGLEP